MKTTELIEKLNALPNVKAKVAYENIEIVRETKIPYSYPLLFSLPVDAYSVLAGTFYAENLGNTNLVTIGRIAKLLEEYTLTPQKDRSEPKYYHFFSTAPILADSNYKYLAVNMNNGDYVLTCKNPVLPNFKSIFSSANKIYMEDEGLLEGFEPEEIK